MPRRERRGEQAGHNRVFPAPRTVAHSLMPLRLSTEPPHRSLRWALWLCVLIAVLTLHWLGGRWIERSKNVSNPEPPQHLPVQVTLLTPKPIEQAPAPAPVPPPVHERPRVQPKQETPATTHAITPPSPGAEELAAMQAAQAEQALAQAANEAANQAASQAANEAAAAKASAEQAARQTAQQAAPGDKFDVPPSGDLHFNTLVNGVMNQTGTIHWTHEGDHFEMITSIPLLFVGPFVYSSTGHIDRFGLAPDQHLEQRGRRAADITVFDRANKQLVYTRTPNNQPLLDGAQDRFSIVMQLVSLVRGSPDTYKPGVVRQFSVADNDSSETWPLETIGDENIQTGDGNVMARHFTRLARREGDKRRLDIWLAPSLGWLPVRILQTEPNGLQVEMIWRGPLRPPSASADGSGTPDASEVPTPASPPADKP